MVLPGTGAATGLAEAQLSTAATEAEKEDGKQESLSSNYHFLMEWLELLIGIKGIHG